MPQTLKLKIPDETITSFTTPTDLSAATGGTNTPVPYQFTYQHTFQATPLPERAISPKAQPPSQPPQQPVFAPSPLSGPPITKTIAQPQLTQKPRSSSPIRPPVEPIDPAEVLAQLGKVPAKATKTKSPLPEPVFIPRPDPVPISESENSDAIALRSAIALLQLQREKSKRDLQALEKVRLAALRDPAGFVEETKKRVVERKGKPARKDEDVLTPTLEGRIEKLAKQSQKDRVANGDTTMNDDQAKARSKDGEPSSKSPPSNHTTPASASDSDSDEDEGPFPVIPTPQNIFRMPPINWAKYSIAGETLEKIHNEEVIRPNIGQPERSATYTPTSAVQGGFPFSAGGAGGPRGTPMGSSYGFPLTHPVTGRNPQYVMAAPYSPLTDVIVQGGGGEEVIHPMQTRNGSKKPGL